MAQKPVDVTVDPGVKITVNVNKVKVQKGVDTVAWKSTTNNQKFEIKFPSSDPAAVLCDWQGSKWMCTAGPFEGDPRTIKYDVHATDTPPLDPEIEIQT